MCRSRREATVPGRTRTTCHTYFNLFDDWMLGDVDAAASAHSNAGPVWCIFVHGRRLAEGTAIFRSDFDHFHAGQVPTGFYVFTTGNKYTSADDFTQYIFFFFFVRFQSSVFTYLR